ncbi:hypothetical protein GCM10009827_009030 [Dactylosporangium maewongense]|uniref:Integrase catalytic domain-containing protein n=1 Tax=Dactylosporangium maewongense TaxID=634393 RepID=A0ABP4KEU4_9ACTN
MGPVGDSFDNALMEYFWSTLKIELVHRTSWRTRDQAGSPGGVVRGDAHPLPGPGPAYLQAEPAAGVAHDEAVHGAGRGGRRTVCGVEVMAAGE